MARPKRRGWRRQARGPEAAPSLTAQQGTLPPGRHHTRRTAFRHAAGFLDDHILQVPPAVELTPDTGTATPGGVVRRLAFDRTLPPSEALGRIRDTFHEQVGHNGLSCIITDPSGPEAECTATFDVPGGQITTQFLNSPPPEKHAAVTGGTGAYRNARGEAVLVERGDGTGTVTFHLIGSRANE